MEAVETCDLLCLDLPKAEELRRNRLSARSAATGAAAASALGAPIRLTIAAALAEGEELCVCDLAWVVERSEKLVSHHLRLLHGAGLVRSRREGKMVMYSLMDSGRVLLEAVTEGVSPVA
jgi:DNA-binding transcriptional ArsR family regulator